MEAPLTVRVAVYFSSRHSLNMRFNAKHSEVHTQANQQIAKHTQSSARPSFSSLQFGNFISGT